MQCQADKAAVEERMKQLRNMINSDFNNMVGFGKEVFSESIDRSDSYWTQAYVESLIVRF